jgi:HK97 gp10 family phage protein
LPVPEVTLEGFAALQARLEALGAKAAKVENAALREGAKPLAKAMSETVAVSDRNETHIRDDIVTSSVKTKDGVKFIEVGPGKDTNWRAKFLEWGTSKSTARPFAGPAAVNSKSDVLDAMGNVVKKGIGL